MKIRPHWRKMTWVVLLFNAIMLVWLIAGVATATHNPACNGLSQSTCQAATDVGASIGAGLIIGLWLAGDVILGILWLVTHGRSCPVCGKEVRRGVTVCKSCDYDFRGAAAS